jgi:uncharacterized protein GlcG (DUF336 family)
MMTNKPRIIPIGILFLLIYFLPSLSLANNPTHKILPLDLTIQAATAALKQCQDDGYKVSVAIVDQAGLIKVHLKADGAGPHTLDSSFRKAYTANSLRGPTHKFAVMVANNAELQGLASMNENILLLGGGFPIIINGETMGGVGVGGAPGVELDETCARAALKVLKADDMQEKK